MGDEWTLDDFYHLHIVQLLKENMAANLHLRTYSSLLLGLSGINLLKTETMVSKNQATEAEVAWFFETIVSVLRRSNILPNNTLRLRDLKCEFEIR